jgi:hypothetical protein
VAFGHQTPTLVPLQPKRLKAKDPRVVKKFLKSVKKTMRSTGYPSRFANFKHQSHARWDSSLEREYNSLQQENTRIRKAAERKISKLTMGDIPWSLEIQNFRDKIELWEMLVWRKKKVKVSVKRIRRVLKKGSSSHAFTRSLKEALSIRDAAYQEYKTAKEQAPQMRAKFQESLAVTIAAKRGTDAVTESNNLKRIKRQQRQARNVKRMRGRLGNSRVTKLWYTNDDGSRVQCNTQHSMENACFQENESCFSQSEVTPPMQEPMVSELGYLADTRSKSCKAATNLQKEQTSTA